jgi:hypothetical protein
VTQQSSSDDRRRFRVYLEVAAAVATILAVAVPAAIFVADHLGSSSAGLGTGAGGTAPALGAGPSTGTSSPAGPPTGNVVFLDSLTPDTGSTNIAPLPRALRGQPGYDHAVAIPCGTNNVGDQQRRVAYVINKRYLDLHAVVRVYKKASDESNVRVSAFPDSGTPVIAMMEVNQSRDLSVDLDGVQRLSIEVACDLPDAVAVLTDARLTHV